MPSRSRRGGNAIEFALVMPVLMAMLAGLMDYGWYFWRETLLLNAMREAVRAGSIQSPLETETGGTCSACISVAQASITQSLSDQGYSSVTLTPTLNRVPTSGTPCAWVLTLSGTIPHTRMFTLIPGPNTIKISLVSVAQNVTCS